VVAPPDTGSANLLSVATTAHGLVVAGRASDGQTEPQPLAWLRSGNEWVNLSFSVPGAGWLNAVGTDAGGSLWGVGTAFPQNATLSGLAVRGCPGV
jgi:hypothetical protein